MMKIEDLKNLPTLNADGTLPVYFGDERPRPDGSDQDCCTCRHIRQGPSCCFCGHEMASSQAKGYVSIGWFCDGWERESDDPNVDTLTPSVGELIGHLPAGQDIAYALEVMNRVDHYF